MSLKYINYIISSHILLNIWQRLNLYILLRQWPSVHILLKRRKCFLCTLVWELKPISVYVDLLTFHIFQVFLKELRMAFWFEKVGGNYSSRPRTYYCHTYLSVEFCDTSLTAMVNEINSDMLFRFIITSFKTVIYRTDTLHY